MLPVAGQSLRVALGEIVGWVAESLANRYEVDGCAWILDPVVPDRESWLPPEELPNALRSQRFGRTDASFVAAPALFTALNWHVGGSDSPLRWEGVPAWVVEYSDIEVFPSGPPRKDATDRPRHFGSEVIVLDGKSGEVISSCGTGSPAP